MTVQTAWQRVARDVCDKILSGETAVGSKIASQQQMVNRLDVSLGTVKRALEHLESRGVIEARHGAGTFVLRIPTDEDARPTSAATLERRVEALEREVEQLKRQSRPT